MTMKKNRIEVLVNVVPVDGKFQAQAQIRYVHDTIIQKVVEAKGELYDNEADAQANKALIEKTLKRTLLKVKDRIPTAKVFHHEFTKS